MMRSTFKRSMSSLYALKLLIGVISCLALLMSGAAVSAQEELIITTESLDNGIIEKPYSQALESSGGTPPYTWAISSGSLPSWASLNPDTGVISGTPTEPGTIDFTVEVTDSADISATKPLSLTVNSLIVITTFAIQPGAEDMSYNQTLSASGGSGDYSWSVSGGTLPSGLTLNSEGMITGRPGKGGIYNFTVTVKDSSMDSASKKLTVNILEPGYLYTWGDNSNGQLGNNSTTDRNSPVRTDNLDREEIISIAAGGLHSLVLDEDGDVWAWGDNAKGQLGIGSTTDKITPERVDDVDDVIVISAGYQHSLALDNDGNVWAWGNNSYGQLGIGSTVSQKTPVRVKSLENIAAISAGYNHSLALKSDGTVWAWGYNNKGQLGSGSTTTDKSPAQVKGINGEDYLTGITAISAGYYHNLALSEDGSLQAWGDNSKGQLGIGSITSSKNPIMVDDLEDEAIKSIAAGGLHSLALDEHGDVWAWGYNNKGQLGIGSTTDKRTPARIKDIDDIMAIAAGNIHSMALEDNGELWVWGDNANGQLGIGSTTAKNSPEQIDVFDDVLYIAANADNSLAISGDDLDIVEEVTITTTSLTDGMAGKSYSQTLKAEGGSGDYSWTKASGDLPAGLSLNSSTGRISGTPEKAGEFSFKIKVTDKNDSSITNTASFSITIDSGIILSTVATSGFNSNSTIQVDEKGYTQSSIQVTTPDGKITLSIPKGSELIDSQDNPVTALTAAVLNAPLTPPANAEIISAYYFGPDGASFDPSLTLTFKYKPADLPMGVSENGLFLAYYDNNQWQALSSKVDTDSNVVTAKISHFSIYALCGGEPPTGTNQSNEKPAAPFSWWRIVIIVAAVVIILLIILKMLQNNRYGSRR